MESPFPGPIWQTKRRDRFSSKQDAYYFLPPLYGVKTTFSLLLLKLHFYKTEILFERSKMFIKP